MDKSIKVKILGRDYPLRVREEDERSMREIAAWVDQRMQAFREAFPEQPELTAAVITAMTLAEEYHLFQQSREVQQLELEREIKDLSLRIESALGETEPSVKEIEDQ